MRCIEIEENLWGGWSLVLEPAYEKSKRLLVSPKRDIKKLEEIEETETPVAVDIWPVSRSKGVGEIVATGCVVDYDADTRTLRFVADTMDPIGSKIHLDKVFRIMLCPNEVPFDRLRRTLDRVVQEFNPGNLVELGDIHLQSIVERMLEKRPDFKGT